MYLVKFLSMFAAGLNVGLIYGLIYGLAVELVQSMENDLNLLVTKYGLNRNVIYLGDSFLS